MLSTLTQHIYLVQNGFATQGFHVPEALAGKTDLLITGQEIVNWILGFVGTVAFLMIIWGAFTLLTAAGNADRIKKGKMAILYAVIGIVIIALSYSASMFLADNLSPAVLNAPATQSTAIGTSVPGMPTSPNSDYRLLAPAP